MERHFIRLALFFTLLVVGFDHAQASILVTNDWASAAVQVRDLANGGIETVSGWEGEAYFNVSATSPGGDWGNVDVTQSAGSGTLVDARVTTEDSHDSEIEAWLQTSWVFSVTDAAVDFMTSLWVEEGGDFTSAFSLYDLTAGEYVFSNTLDSYGQAGNSGTLLADHSYLFSASLPRFDRSAEDLVEDGSSGLFFMADTDIIFDPARTHLEADIDGEYLQSAVPEPLPLYTLISGLLLLGIARRPRRRKS